jgi:Zn-dependent M28 family amino/carboxypeptidase
MEHKPVSRRDRLTAFQAQLREGLRRDVDVLASRIGARHWRLPARLAEAADYLRSELEAAGHTVRELPFETRGQRFSNFDVTLPGERSQDEIVVIGAHYDSVDHDDCPGANDNGTGVAAILALARSFAGARPARTLRFAFFANEEPPFFHRSDQGSRFYARACRERGERVAAMLSVETIGYYSDAPGSQKYPPVFGWFYPDVGDFVAFIGNRRSRALVERAARAYRRRATSPSEHASVPGFIPGVGWSDHWSFWKEGFPAAMVTDTAPFRDPFYHSGKDTADRLDFDRLAKVVDGLHDVVHDLADE